MVIYDEFRWGVCDSAPPRASIFNLLLILSIFFIPSMPSSSYVVTEIKNQRFRWIEQIDAIW